MWGHLIADEDLFSITNGIHMPTWFGYDVRDLLAAPEVPWDEKTCKKMQSKLDDTDDKRLWKAHRQQKQRMIRVCRFLIREQWSRHGKAPDELNKIKNLINPDALLIGFARRFATYKRANLIFRDLERAKKILGDPDRPVQIIFAGKAHPADGEGQGLIKEIYDYMAQDGLENSIIFLENYDMNLANHLVQGVDVWLNSPRRPNEASGTSGMKAALNGILNLSISDGWWAEGFNGENGWKFGIEEIVDDHQHQDEVDAGGLYETLENEVIPSFFERNDNGVPVDWVAKMRSSIKTVIPQFSSNRMVGDYEQKAYQQLLKQ
jgi:starch phosphorylase